MYTLRSKLLNKQFEITFRKYIVVHRKECTVKIE